MYVGSRSHSFYKLTGRWNGFTRKQYFINGPPFPLFVQIRVQLLLGPQFLLNLSSNPLYRLFRSEFASVSVSNVTLELKLIVKCAPTPPALGRRAVSPI
jgi:hypothetical protein